MSDLNLLTVLENIDKLDAAASNEFLRSLCKEAAKELVELNALRLRRGTQEPVAWVYTNAKGRSVLVETNTSPFEDATPLYTHPPQSEWQGLTAEEIEEGWYASWVEKQAFETACLWANSKLKEKNT